MKKLIAAAALILLSTGAVLAQQPAAQPSTTTKAVEAAGALAGKVLGTTPAAQPAALPAKAPLVNINKASASDLDSLPQIGEARSKAIIAGRPYKATKDLLDRKIVPANAYDAIKDKIAVK